MRQALITLSRIDNHITKEGDRSVYKEKITCPQGVEVKKDQIRDRRSGQVLVWRDSDERWHSTGTGAVYTSVAISNKD